MSNNIIERIGVGYMNNDGKRCMIRCFECGKENYAMTVASGFCAWCGHDANEKGQSHDE